MINVIELCSVQTRGVEISFLCYCVVCIVTMKGLEFFWKDRAGNSQDAFVIFFIDVM